MPVSPEESLHPCLCPSWASPAAGRSMRPLPAQHASSVWTTSTRCVLVFITRRQELGKLAEDNSNLAGGPSAMLWVDRGRHVMLRAEHLCFRLVYSTQRRQNRRRKDGKKSTLLLRGFAKLRGGGGMRPDKMHTLCGGYETLCNAAISSRRTATRGVWFARYFFSFSKPSDRPLAPCTSRTYI